MSTNIDHPTTRKVMSFYLVVKHDYVSTKESSVLKQDERSCLFTDKRNALEELEACAKSAVVAVNGIEHATKCMYDEKRFIRKQGQACIEKKYYITKDAKESPDKLTVWRKYDVTKTKPGTLYGVKSWVETVVEKQFSVSVVRVSSEIWGLRPTTPSVAYKQEWLAKALKVPKGNTEDEYLAKEHRDLSHEFSEFLRTTAVFKILSDRFTQEEVPAINLPKIRFEHAVEFLKCPLANVWTPPPVKVEPPKVETPKVEVTEPAKVVEAPKAEPVSEAK